jgi:CHASE1-domain containing sensor protein
MTHLPRSSSDWTDASDNDPGITFLEVLLFITVAAVGVVVFGTLKSRRRVHRRGTT